MSDASSQPFDQTMRRLVGSDVHGLCRLLGVRVEGAGPGPAGGAAGAPALGARFPGRAMEADLLVRVGPRQLLHVEFQLRAEPGLAGRILRYRAAISHAYPSDLLEQVVVVLGSGDLDSVDDLPDHAERPGFRLGCWALYLRDVDPEVLLADPAWAALAVLGRGSPQDRVRALAAALWVIRKSGGPHMVERLEAAAILATIRLDGPTIDTAREASMSTDSMADFYADIADFWDETWIGRELRQRGHADGVEMGRAQGVEAGRAQGVEAGRAQGVEAGRAQALAALIVERFGDRPEVAVVAERLARRADLTATFREVLAAAVFEDLTAD